MLRFESAPTSSVQAAAQDEATLPETSYTLTRKRALGFSTQTFVVSPDSPLPACGRWFSRTWKVKRTGVHPTSWAQRVGVKGIKTGVDIARAEAILKSLAEDGFPVDTERSLKELSVHYLRERAYRARSLKLQDLEALRSAVDKLLATCPWLTTYPTPTRRVRLGFAKPPRERFGRRSSVVAMTYGSGSHVLAYSQRRRSKATRTLDMLHEFGHVFFDALANKFRREFEAMPGSRESRCTAYARQSDREWFCEALSLYCDDRGQFTSRYSRQARAVAAVLRDFEAAAKLYASAQALYTAGAPPSEVLREIDGALQLEQRSAALHRMRALALMAQFSDPAEAPPNAAESQALVLNALGEFVRFVTLKDLRTAELGAADWALLDDIVYALVQRPDAGPDAERTTKQAALNTSMMDRFDTLAGNAESLATKIKETLTKVREELLQTVPRVPDAVQQGALNITMELGLLSDAEQANDSFATVVSIPREDTAPQTLSAPESPARSAQALRLRVGCADGTAIERVFALDAESEQILTERHPKAPPSPTPSFAGFSAGVNVTSSPFGSPHRRPCPEDSPRRVRARALDAPQGGGNAVRKRLAAEFKAAAEDEAHEGQRRGSDDSCDFRPLGDAGATYF